MVDDFVSIIYRQHVFVSELLYSLFAAGLIDHAYLTQASPFQQADYVSKVQLEAQDHGQELEVSPSLRLF